MIERNERNNVDNDLIEMTKAQLTSVEALYEIAIESTDANIVRLAVAGMLATPAGSAYLVMHGLNV